MSIHQALDDSGFTDPGWKGRKIMSKQFIRWILPFVFLALVIATSLIVLAPTLTHAAPAKSSTKTTTTTAVQSTPTPTSTKSTTALPNAFWWP